MNTKRRRPSELLETYDTAITELEEIDDPQVEPFLVTLRSLRRQAVVGEGPNDELVDSWWDIRAA
jgi:hypothetical protein